MKLAPKESKIPRSLRDTPLWFATGLVDNDSGDLGVAWYSAVTLNKLDWNRLADFTVYEVASRMVRDHVWLDATEIRIKPPLLSVIVPNGLHEDKRPQKWLKSLAAGLIGYWEVRPNHRDVLGVLKTSQPIAPGFGNYRGNLVFVTNDARVGMTGEPLRGLRYSPETTNQAAVKEMVEEIRRGSPMLDELMRRERPKEQLRLF